MPGFPQALMRREPDDAGREAFQEPASLRRTGSRSIGDENHAPPEDRPSSRHTLR